MPHSHFGPARPAARRQRRKLVWATLDQSIAMGAQQVKIVDLLSQLELAGVSKLGVTVMRVHGRLLFPTGVTQKWEVAIGVNPMTTVGTQLPNPNGDNDIDWMIFDRPMQTFSGATVDADTSYTVDLKSRRKVDEMGQTLTLNLWASAISAGTVEAFFRTLVALP